VARVLDQFNVDVGLTRRWDGNLLGGPNADESLDDLPADN